MHFMRLYNLFPIRHINMNSGALYNKFKNNIQSSHIYGLIDMGLLSCKVLNTILHVHLDKVCKINNQDQSIF